VGPPQGAGDRDLQRRTSVDALAQYRRQQELQQQAESRFSRPPASVPTSPSSSPAPSGAWGQAPRYERYDDWSRARTTYYDQRSWTPPAYAYQSSPSFGMWDGMMLWFLLDNLRRPGNADFFHHQQGDPGYRAWRADADRLAADNPDLRSKLRSLDGELSSRAGQPRDPSYAPPGIDPRIALSANQAVRKPPAEASSGSGLLIVVVVVLAGGAVLFWLWRRRRQAAPARTATPMAELGKPMTKFRVGMTVTLDPTPFLVAGDALRFHAPTAGNNGLVGIEAVGALDGQGATLHRLYLPGGDAFFQLHLDAHGEVDECRYFTRFDEVTPATPDEWGFWLDDRDGMIGWPEFETKDGKRHGRIWSPGGERATPLHFEETIQAVDGPWTRKHDAMLYGLSTGLAAPSPATEYLLVSAVEGEAGARIELHLGIDINPAGLSLT